MQRRVIDDPVLMQQKADMLLRQSKRIGIVPTMGALHDGHLSLVHRSKRETDFTIVTIFVNPAQFAPTEDLEKYPRSLERDLELLQNADTDMVFLPTAETMYPKHYDTFVEMGDIAKRLEGEFRPTHYRGVATVVLKLFNITKANVGYFGQKDYQQCCVIQKMVRDFNLPIEIVLCPIVREPDGLAMSSRNRYLSPDERSQAVVLSQSLAVAQKMLDAGIVNAAEIKRTVQETIAKSPLARIDYVSIADPLSLNELTDIPKNANHHASAVLLLAVRFGNTRLIDNAMLGR